jgi:hypothetical protein
MRPLDSEYAPFYRGYVSHVTEDDIVAVLTAQIEDLGASLGAVEDETYRYAPGKWSIREVTGHLIDAERVFGYRAFSISRGETKNLPGFDENEYLLTAPYDHVALKDLLDEFRLVRSANTSMLKNLDDQAWLRIGTANDSPVSVRALAFIMAGHLRHHLGVLRERYALDANT